MRIYDHTGKKYGTWSVTEMFHKDGNKFYRCLCDCGNTKIVARGHLLRKSSCEKCKPKIMHDSHIGEKHGKLTCLGYHKVKKGHGYLIQCDCGAKYTVNNYYQFKKSSSCKKCIHGFHPGKRIGNSILMESIGNGNWKKKCDCGSIFIGTATRKTDCGCIAKKKILDLALKKVGRKYHYLTVKAIHRYSDGHIHLVVKCKCGNQFIRHNGHEFKSRSCGCEFVVPVGEKANKATMSNCEVISIRQLYESGLYSINHLSNMFNKKPNYISRIVNRNIWKHI